VSANLMVKNILQSHKSVRIHDVDMMTSASGWIPGIPLMVGISLDSFTPRRREDDKKIL